MVVELPHPDGPRPKPEPAQKTVEHMLCPHCRTGLSMTVRQNVEIDYCPTCRGVWLDRGELDKIIERSQSLTPPRGEPPRRDRDRKDRRYDDDDDYDDDDYKKRRHKNSLTYFLKEIFD